MKKLLILLFLPLMLINCGGCSDKKTKSNPLLYKGYIASFTNGLVSSSRPIVVQLDAQVPEEEQSKIPSLDLFDISPSVKGKTEYSSVTNELRFIPNEPLKQDTEYGVSLRLSKLYKDIPKELSTFHFTFRTIQQHYEVRLGELQSYNKDLYYLSGDILASDYLNLEEAKKILSVSLNGKGFPVKILGSDSSTKIPFIIDSIPSALESSHLQVDWKDNGEEKDVKMTIPSRNSFYVVSHQISPEDRSVILINFSKPLKKKQNFSGLVEVQGDTSYYYVVSDNVLKVILKKPLVGDYQVNVNAGIESAYGDKIQAGSQFDIYFPPINPEVRFVKNGTILPNSKNLKINFQAVNLRAVDVKVYEIFKDNILQFLQENSLASSYELYRVASPIAEKRMILESGVQKESLTDYNSYAIDLANLITPNPGAIYHIVLSYKKEYALVRCGEEAKVLTPYENYDFTEEGTPNNNNDDDYYEDDYDYDWSERDNPCSDSYYHNKDISINVLASNLGVIVKKGQNNEYVVIVNDINTTEPISDALVEVYSFQQQKIGEMSTSGDGVAKISTPKEGAFVVVKKNKNTTYVKIADGNSLSLSSFDVDGTQLQKGLNGYIYTERGVWRPGDKIYVGFILNDFENKIPQGLPIKLTFKDPYGKVVQQKVQMSNPLNQYAFTLQTDKNAQTGNWQVEISAGAARFYKTIKVETIKPNRLKILSNIEGKDLESGETINWKIQWLQGLPAGNTTVNIKAKFTPTKTEFKNYRGYVFDNPFMDFEAYEYILADDDRTNEQGELETSFLPEISEAPGMLNVHFLTKASERGGDFSTDVVSAKYSPYEEYAGIKSPKPNKYNYYNTNEKHTFDLVCVSQNGKPIANRELEVLVFKTDWSWWWDASNRNMSSYTSSNRRNLYSSFMVKTNSKGKATLDINIPSADWGRYVILVSDTDNEQSSAISAYFDWANWYGRSDGNNSKEATMLMVSSDKEAYNVNERAEISFPSAEGGRALISVENGTKVLQTDWIVTEKGETTYELPITSEMTPNVYVSVTLLQPHANSENDHPIRLYGVLPIKVENKDTKLEPEIQMPDLLRPEQETTIKVSEKSGKPMAYTLALVEDGLLDLTRFRTPNAWNSFFAKTALGVKTWDIYNDVIGAYGGKINQVFAIGGDENLAGAKSRKANRFQPLVIFEGPFYLEKGEVQSHKIKLPNYIGSARVMVVASDVKDNAYGSTDKTIPVRSPLMVLGSLPRKAVPGEEITLPVTVFTLENQIRNVNVQIESDGKLQISGANKKSLTFSEPSEKMAYFKLKVGQQTGVAKLKITATSGKEKAVYEVELDVYNPNPRTYESVSSVLSKGVGETLNWNIFGAKGTNEVSLEVSNFPGVNLSQRMEYLLAYPHGCSEQITSKAFPQLYLDNFEKISEKRMERIQNNINSAIAKLFERQLPSGGFSYWSGGTYENDWVTSYVGNFMLEAEKKGYVLPPNSKQNWINYQSNKARVWQYEPRYQNDILQAYRLYTLALANQPDMASMNRLRETPDLSNEAQMRLASAYVLAGQQKVAQNLLRKVTISDIGDNDAYYYYGSPTRNRAMALETAILLKDKKLSATLALKIAEKLSSKDWLSTQTIAFALVSMAHYVADNKSAPIDITITYNGKKETLKTSEPVLIKSLSVNKGEQQLFVKNNSQGTAYVKVINSGILPVGDELAQQQGLKITTQFRNASGGVIQPDRIVQGTEFIGELTITNLTQNGVENVALTQLIPSGWEIINMRYTDYGGINNQVDYTDIRDDRANFYFSLGANKSKTFQVILNASYLGKYYLPGAYAEAMYNPDYRSRTKGEWVEVVGK